MPVGAKHAALAAGVDTGLNLLQRRFIMLAEYFCFRNSRRRFASYRWSKLRVVVGKDNCGASDTDARPRKASRCVEKTGLGRKDYV
jgi:hypothetical protein